MMIRSNNKGFTLVEVLLAITLLGIALIPIIQSMPSIYRVNRDMIIENTMSFYAQDKLEEVKSAIISDFDTDRTQNSQVVLNEDLKETDYRYNIIDDGGTDIGGDANKDIKIITVQMWYGREDSTYAGAGNKIELKTKVSKRSS